MVNIINVISVCVHVFPVIIYTYNMSAILLLFTPRHRPQYWEAVPYMPTIIIFFYILGSALVKCGETEKKIGQAGRELKAKSMTNFLHQLKTFLEGDMKTIAVSTLTFYICTVV